MAAIGRRTFCVAAATTLAVGPPARSRAPIRLPDVITALERFGAIERLAGGEDLPVSGVMLTARPTLAALQEAVAAGCSLVVSPESPLYARAPQPSSTGPMAPPLVRAIAADEASPAFVAKTAFIAAHKLVVLRVTPTGDSGGAATEALADKFGWASYRRAGEHQVYTPPGLTVSRLAELAHARLNVTGGLRTIGRPDLPLSSVLLVAGTARVVPTIRGLAGADALLTGDLREWEIVEYLHDSAEAGHAKALVAVGRVLSEQPFVERCADAIRAALPGLPLRVPPIRDPFWRVQA